MCFDLEHYRHYNSNKNWIKRQVHMFGRTENEIIYEKAKELRSILEGKPQGELNGYFLIEILKLQERVDKLEAELKHKANKEVRYR
jgi:hypothetical protein